MSTMTMLKTAKAGAETKAAIAQAEKFGWPLHLMRKHGSKAVRSALLQANAVVVEPPAPKAAKAAKAAQVQAAAVAPAPRKVRGPAPRVAVAMSGLGESFAVMAAREDDLFEAVLTAGGATMGPRKGVKVQLTLKLATGKVLLGDTNATGWNNFLAGESVTMWFRSGGGAAAQAHGYAIQGVVNA